jgi:chemotaxis protein CheD
MYAKMAGIGECVVSSNPEDALSAYGLGSCIAVTMHDPIAKIGGLLHFLLPDSTVDIARCRGNPLLSAETGIPELLRRCVEAGATKKRLVVRAVGGASIVQGAQFFDIGRRNHVSLRKALWKAGLLVNAEAVGGNVSRSVRLQIGTGEVWIREDEGPSVELVPMPMAMKRTGT